MLISTRPEGGAPTRAVLEISAVILACVIGLAVARVPVLYLAVGIGALLVGMGSLYEPLVGVAAALVLGPFGAWLSLWYPQVPAYVGQLAFFVAIGAWAVRLLIGRRWKTLTTPPLLGGLLLFMGAQLLSLWQPADVWMGFMEFAKWGQVLVMLLLVWERLQDERLPKRWAVIGVLGALALAALVQVGVGLWQFAFWREGPETFAIDARFSRAYGTFEQPNPYAGFLGLIAPVFVGAALVLGLNWLRGCWRERKITRPSLLLALAVTLAFLFSVGLGMSWSRGGWMAFGAALLAMAALLPRKLVWSVLLVAVLVVGGLLAYQAGLIPASILDRLTGFLAYMTFSDQRGVAINDANFSFVERMSHWQAAISMWRDNFWFGVGFGNYEAAYAEYRLINWVLPLGHAHNYYLNLLAETGIIGLGAYLVFMGVLAIRLLDAIQRLDGWQRGLALGLAGAFAYLAVHNMVDNVLVNNSHLHFGVLLALSAYVISDKRISRGDAEGR